MSTITDVITRAEYMRDNVGTRAEQHANHRRYYAQFVTDETLAYLRRIFSVAELVRAFAQDEPFNAFPLGTWDLLTWRSTEENPSRARSIAARSIGGPFVAVLPFDRSIAAQAGESITRAVLICIAKEAAHQLVEAAQTQTEEPAA